MRLVTDGSPADLSLILVHGTWGRGVFPSLHLWTPWLKKPRWFMPGSKFRSSLKDKLTAHTSEQTYSVSTFEWSGSNSFIKRAEAAAELAKQLDDDAVSHPAQKHILIGHSHGGSVCMLAMKYMQIARPNIVTLATPFIELDATGILPLYSKGRFLTDLFRAASIGVFWFMAALVIVSVIAGTVAGLVLRWTNPTRPRVLLTFPYTDAFLYLPYPWLQHPWIAKLLALPVGLRGYLLGWQWSRHTLDIHWAVGGLVQTRPFISMLVLRGVDDEATLALTAGAIGNRLTAPLMILATVAIALGIVVRAGTALIGEPFLTATHTSELYLPLTYAIPLAWLINVVAGCFKSVYGREMVAWSIGMQIRSHSSPDHAGRLSIITVPYGGKGGLIRHSMYDHDAATEAIRRWIAQDFMLWPVETDVMA